MLAESFCDGSATCVAVTAVKPTERLVTSPVAVTVATAGLLLSHVTGTGFVPTSALTCSVPPRSIPVKSGVMVKRCSGAIDVGSFYCDDDVAMKAKDLFLLLLELPPGFGLGSFAFLYRRSVLVTLVSFL